VLALRLLTLNSSVSLALSHVFGECLRSSIFSIP
jgi:hypothetical protein